VRKDAAIVIRRPPRTVFPFVADAENAGRFRPDVVAVRRTSGTPAAPGATYRQVVKLDWRRVEVLVENTEHQPDQRLSFATHEPDGVTLITTYSFQPIELEHTRVTVTTDGPARNLSRLARSLRKRDLEGLRELKRTLESRPFRL
jgi:hypothetical protein